MHFECSSLDVVFILICAKHFQRKRILSNYTFFTMNTLNIPCMILYTSQRGSNIKDQICVLKFAFIDWNLKLKYNRLNVLIA